MITCGVSQSTLAPVHFSYFHIATTPYDDQGCSSPRRVEQRLIESMALFLQRHGHSKELDCRTLQFPARGLVPPQRLLLLRFSS